MTLDDADLQKLHQRATAAQSRRDCPSSETLARAAAGDIAPAEREQVADHLAGCADCAEEYRLVLSLKPWAGQVGSARSRRPGLAGGSLALAAAVVIGVSAGVWSYVELQRARQATQQAEVAAGLSRQEAATLRRNLEALSQPQLDMVVADLFPPDAIRGDRGSAVTSEQVVTVPAGARLFSVILNLAGPATAREYALEILNDSGSPVWQGSGLHSNRYNTFTVALTRTLLPAGRYRLVLKTVPPGPVQTVQEYSVRIQYEN